jgi:hypothetical protein
MEGYRYQQFAYLIVPLTVGVEFFLTSKNEKKLSGKVTTWTVVMEALGYLFTALVPALFLFTIFSLESHRFPIVEHILHRLDRYGVMFFFLGSWWQVFLIASLRARRIGEQEGRMFLKVWFPYLAYGGFISALILWVAPWNLMWVSFFWFIGTFGLFAVLDVSPRKTAKVFLVLAVVVFFIENVFFIVLDAIV